MSSPTLPKTRRNSQSQQRDRTLQKRQPTLPDSDLRTLLNIARACDTLTDAKDAINLFSLLDESLKPQLKQALKTLPSTSKKRLRDAATSQRTEGRA